MHLKKCCIVHIGMNKTGSSSIQETLGTKLKDPGFSYISLSSHNHSGKIVSLFMESPENMHSHVKRGLTRKQIDAINEDTHQKLVQNFTENSAETHIISGEGISKLSELELLRLKIFLKKYFQKVIIVAYFRTPYSFMQSAFQQRVKGGLKNFHVKNMYPDYKNLFAKFDKIFSKENVYLWKYEPENFVNGDVVLDFCTRLNIEIPKMDIKRENEGLSLEAMSLLYCYHKFGEGYGIGKKVIKENELLIAALKTLGNTKFTFSYKLIEPILHNNKDDLHWMEERTGNILDEKPSHTSDEIGQESELLATAIKEKNRLSELMFKHGITKKFDSNSPQELAQQIHLLRMALSQNHFKVI